jgi:N-acetylglutamate synthase/N-acetylornithine aminotransferase
MAIIAGQVQTLPYQYGDSSQMIQSAQNLAMTGAQGISDIAGQAKDYFKQQGEKKKQVKMASTQIEAALKLMPELAPILGDVGNRLKDEDVSLTDRFADASVVPDLIKNSMSGLISQQMMNLRQQKFAASQGGGGGGSPSGGAPAQVGFVVQ